MTKYLNAIIYTETPQPVTGKRFLKYHGIADVEHKIAAFCQFAAKFPGALYVNFYHKDNKAFKERIYLQ